MDRLNQADRIWTWIKSVPALSAWKILISQRALRTSGLHGHAALRQSPLLHNGPIIKTPTRHPPLASSTKGSDCTIKADDKHFSEEDEILSGGSVGSLRALLHGWAPPLSKQWRGVTTLRCGQVSSRVAQQSTPPVVFPPVLCAQKLRRSGFEKGTEVWPDRCCHVRITKSCGKCIIKKMLSTDESSPGFPWQPLCNCAELLVLRLV